MTGAAIRGRPMLPGQKARPTIVSRQHDVFTAAYDRIRWLYEQFPGGITVSCSGGKDSTIVVELAAMVAREHGFAPPRVFWLDQECEFQGTVDYMRYLAYERDDIDMRWYQIPFDIDNSTSADDHWLHVWDPALGPEGWMRDKEPISIKDNTYCAPHWYELLRSISNHDLPEDGCQITGIRVEESPARRLSLTSNPQYKWVCWSVRDIDPCTPDRQRYRFSPIYDWSYRDVWKAIEDHGWRYNSVYDAQYRYGVGILNMRVSNFTHETALHSLRWLQEVEPETWEKATQRLAGINTYGHLQKEQVPKKLPYMFKDWSEYAHYLIDNLVTLEENREQYRAHYRRLKKLCEENYPWFTVDDVGNFIASGVILGDLYGTKINNLMITLRHQARERGEA